MSKFNLDELCRLRSDLKTGDVVGSTLRYQYQIDRYIKALDDVINGEPAVEHSLLPLAGEADKAYMRGYEVGKAEGILKANARPTDEWEERTDERWGGTTIYCPYCKEDALEKYSDGLHRQVKSNFCPNCGIKLEKGGAEE